ncbi:MAG: ABC transporter permease [Hamadaea sp.]|uniref:ABC transporter permease n=1 Tax=Hamadaea sp. TaxID=2024425 RepID=UPI001816700E|nr:ABC transporter permease [Hamadaea sp.]NUR71034.1 ABC transporter permease [Hamadaea sp.]NUT23715.1 ABC transporter permease [Hamadaea sp.]
MNATMFRTELRLYFRDVAAVIFGILLAPAILAVLGSVPAFRAADPELGGRSTISIYVPIMLTMAVAMVALSMLPAQLATYRERGILRRLAATPARARDLLAAQALTQLTVLGIGVLLVLTVGWLAYGVDLPSNPTAFVLGFLLVAATLFGIGLVLATAGSAKMTQGLGSLTFFPLMFFAGLWVPREVMPETLQRIGEYTPLGAGVQVMQDATVGHWRQALHVVVLCAYAAVAWGVAARFFRWS